MELKEHTERCKDIAETFEAVTRDAVYECPHCGEWIIDYRELGQGQEGTACEQDENYDESGAMRCPDCGEWVQFGDWTEDDYAEPVTLSNYIEHSYSIEVAHGRLTKDAPITAVILCVAWGGPNIYIDTGDRAVNLYWGSGSGKYPLTADACDALVEVIAEIEEYAA